MRFGKLLLALTLFVSYVIPAHGQTDRGTLRGTLVDQTGSSINGATVVVTSTDTNEKRTVTTDDGGIFVFPELKAGLYQVTAEATGFKRVSVDKVKIDVQGTRSLEIKLEVGEVSGNVVTVNAEAVTLNADTPVRQTTINERQVRELPLEIGGEAGGRTPLAFIFLDSNVGAADQSGSNNASKFRVSGGQGSGTEILIDGASTRRTQNGTFFTEVAPGPNAYQEFTLSTNSYSAEFGNSSGGVVNFTLKSGTNQFHGEGYDLLRNEVLNSNSYYNNAYGLKRNRDNENDYGFNIGGPIYIPNFGEGNGGLVRNLRDRAFFFFNYEGFRFIQGVNSLQSVPTVKERSGDFSELLTDPYVLATTGPIRIYDPRLPILLRTTPIPGNRLDLANTIVNGRPLIDPAGLAILQYYPLPTTSGIHNNYQSTVQVPRKSNQYTMKFDFNLTQKQHLTASYSARVNNRIVGNPLLPLPYVQATNDVFQQNFDSKIARIQHDYTVSPSIINHFNVGYTYYNVKNANTTLGFSTSSLGIPANATSNQAFPYIDFVGDGNFTNSPRFTTDIGGADFSDHIRDGALEFSDSLTYIRGRQTFKVGATVRIAQYNVQQLIHPGGRFGFQEAQTHSDVNDDRFSGSPLASLVTGATEWSFQGNDTVDPAFRQLQQSYFIQDDYKLTSKLTLNLGLRYDLPGVRTEAHDRFRGFDPNAINPQVGIKGAIIGAAGQSGLQAQYKSLIPQDKTNIGPRLGAAYAFDNKTVVRAGIGLFYAPLLYGVGGNGSLKDGTIGYNYDDYLTTPNGDQTPSQYLSTFRALPLDNVNPNTQALGGTVPYFDPNFKTGRTLQYTVDIQRELPYKLIGSIGYIGHRDDRLRSNFGRLNAVPLTDLRLGYSILNKNVNDLTASERGYASSLGINLPANSNAVYAGFNGSVAQALRPFPQYDDITNYLESRGKSNYNALQLKLDRRFSNGYQFGLAYTFSKLMTNASEDILGGSALDGIVQNPFDLKALYALSPTNSPHVFVANFLLEAPFGKGKSYFNKSGFANAILGGFQIGGIFRYQAGVPLSFAVSSDTGHGGSWLDLVGYNGSLRPNVGSGDINQTAPCFANIPANLDRRYTLNCGAFSFPTDFTTPPAEFLAGGAVNPAYATYYSDVSKFFGNSPVVNSHVRSRPFISENLNILKKTRLSETVSFEVGAEFFNIFNRVVYLQPDTYLGQFINGGFNNSNFGAEGVSQYLGASAGNRVIQLRARLIF